jgi:type II secretory pathway component PulM
MITPSTKISVGEPTKTQRSPKAPAIPLGNEAKRRQRLVMGGIGGAALVVALLLLVIFKPWQKPAVKLGGDATKLGEFVGAADFQKMNFEKREIYMKMASAKKDEIARNYAEGRLSLEDYQKSLLAAHLGKRLDDMRKYFAKPMGAERVKYLDKLLTKKETKKVAIDHDPAAKKIEDEQDLLKDDAAQAAEISTWPSDVQGKYKEYTEALNERKKLHKEAMEAKMPKKSPATATAPATREKPAAD